MSSKNVEEIKAESRSLRGTIQESLAADSSHFSDDEYQLLKFHGTYQQDDRDQRAARKAQNQDKAWIFMVRSKLPGGDLTAAQYLEHDKIAGELGNGTLRVTTRQGFQTHGVLKGDLKECIRRINESGVTTWGACGDVVRNTIAAAAPIDDPAHRDAQRLAKEISQAFLARSTAYADIWLNDDKLPVTVNSDQSENTSQEEPIYGKQYLPRKFKIAIAIPPRNDVDVYANDLGFIAQVEAGEVKGYTVVVGGGFGMTHGKQDTYPALAKPLAYVQRDQVIQTAVAVVTVQRDFGNRTDRKRARLKYLIDEKGIEWFRQEVQAQLPFSLQPPKEARWDTVSDLLGWHQQTNGNYFLGLFVENGRIKDVDGYQLKTGLRHAIERFQPEVRLTAAQNLLLVNVRPDQRAGIEQVLGEHTISVSNPFSPTRLASMACPALPTCGLALAESERALPDLLTRIEGLLSELGLAGQELIVRMTGCPNGCARPYMAEIAFVGKAPNKYQIYLGGNEASTRLNRLYKQTVTGEDLLKELRVVLTRYRQERRNGERFGDYCARIIWAEEADSP